MTDKNVPMTPCISASKATDPHSGKNSADQVFEQYSRELQSPTNEGIVLTNLAADTYVETKDERLFNAVFRVATEPRHSDMVRFYAAHRVGEIFDPERHSSKIQDLISALKNKGDYEGVRKALASSLGKIYTKTRQPEILNVIEEQMKAKRDNFKVRTECGQTLAVIYQESGEKSALDKLVCYIKTDCTKVDSKMEAEMFRWLVQFLREGYESSHNQVFLDSLKELLDPNQVEDTFIRQVAITNLYVADGKSESTKQAFRDCHNNDPDWDVKAHAHNALFGNLKVSRG